MMNFKNLKLLNFYCSIAIAIGAVLFVKMWMVHLDLDGNWKKHYEQNQVFGKPCLVAIDQWKNADTPEKIMVREHNFQVRNLPYRGTRWKPQIDSNQYFIAKCKVDLSAHSSKAFTKIDLGQVFGESYIFLNDRKVSEISDDAGVDFPVLKKDRIADTTVSIISRKSKNGFAGPGSLIPMIVSSDRTLYRNAQRSLFSRYFEMPFFRIGISLSIFVFFAFTWLYGMRYPDVSWIIILAAVSALHNFIYYLQLFRSFTQLVEYIRLITLVAQVGFILSFLRLDSLRIRFEKYFVPILLILALIIFSFSQEMYLNFKVNLNIRIISGFSILFLAGAIGVVHAKKVDAPRRRLNRIFLVSLLCNIVSFAYLVEAVLADTLSIRTIFYADSALIINFAVFLATDLIVFQRQYFQEKSANEIAQKDKEISENRNDIMNRFLSHSLVRRFKDHISMKDNLADVLTPRTAKVALMQADIRGFTSLSKKMNPLELTALLQSYYASVVEYAQNVAQVKLIGDCIFLFVEDQAGDAQSPTDHAIEIAQVLIRETKIRNERNQLEIPINFGIAIHFGEVVVGNLSSEQCIDYTVIGDNVNQVARLEEFTKNEKVKHLIGSCGVVVSKEAKENIRAFENLNLSDLNLKDFSEEIRSFPNVTSVSYCTAEDLDALENGIPEVA
ncbi:adenylate/guanylate cyclase domain-containing protein [Oligoflexaceae bacterium]|nr:adenylate/guanylate cyclase domain-containing protein [Oligoflexaceae bacterium]